ncbi:MAG TPA: hypothetical protein VN577_04170 [Terriglobales bacterium]|nr:hypothetical protein [Terriglobales bacterium]
MRAIYLAIFLLFVSSTFIPASQRSQPKAAHVASVRSPGPQFGRDRNQQQDDEIKQIREQMKNLNKDRQKKLKEDTDKLLELATQLKEYVDKTNEDILSLDVIKKAEEIEKLAKSVKDKMKTSYNMPKPVQRP